MKNPQLQAAGAQCSGTEVVVVVVVGTAAQPVLVCTYMPLLHTDSLRQHCGERRGRRREGSWGWIKGWNGGRGGRRPVSFFPPSPILWESCGGQCLDLLHREVFLKAARIFQIEEGYAD